MSHPGDTAVILSPEQERARAAAARLKRYRETRDRARARRLDAHPYLAGLLNRLIGRGTPDACHQRKDGLYFTRQDIEMMRRHW